MANLSVIGPMDTNLIAHSDSLNKRISLGFSLIQKPVHKKRLHIKQIVLATEWIPCYITIN